MSLLHMLEAKHFGRLTNQDVFATAQKHQNFCHEWFIHALRSDTSIDELTLASAYAMRAKTPAIEKVQPLFAENVDQILLAKVQDAIERYGEHCAQVDTEVLADYVTRLLMLLSRTYPQQDISEHIRTCQTDIPSVLTKEVCEQVRPELKATTLYGNDGPGSEDKSIRNNDQFLAPLPNNSISMAIIESMTINAVGTSIAYAEPPVILRYLPGEYYKWHFDHIFPHNDQIQAQIDQFGQRVTTGLFNMNDGFGGGETEFSEPSHKVTPKHGQVISFDNVDDNGDRLLASVHRGCEVTEGEKWIMTIWFRDKPFWLRSGLLSS